jgi:hypothetical protein
MAGRRSGRGTHTEAREPRGHKRPILSKNWAKSNKGEELAWIPETSRRCSSRYAMAR